MNGRTIAAGLCLLFALLFGALAGQAAAKPTPGGTTAFTCKKKAEPGGIGFSKSHCKAADAVASGAEYEHATITEQTEIEASSKNTAGESQAATIRATVAGVNVEVQAKEVTGTGNFGNFLGTIGEHFIHGETVLTYSGASVVAPVEKGCKIKNEKITTETLDVTSSQEGDTLRFQPQVGTVFASFELEGCKAELNGVYKVEGKVKCPPDGATITCAEGTVTEQGTLELRGQKAGLESVITVSGRKVGGTTYTPLSTTTVPVSKGPATGTTAFTCKKKAEVGGAGFSRAHCKSTDAVGAGAEYEHAEVPEYTRTEVSGSNNTTGAESQAAKLKTVVAGVEFEVQATEVATSEGWLENARTTTGEHFGYGEGSITYSGVKVVKPAGKGCKVKGEKVTTKPLMASTAGQAMQVKVDPVEGTLIAEFEVEGCSIGALNGAYKIEGILKCSADGATITCTHAAVTEQATLKARGQKAGYDGVMTLSGRNPELKEVNYTPLSVTTVSTP